MIRLLLDDMLEEIKEKFKLTDGDISGLLGGLAFHLYSNPDLSPEEGLQDLMRDPKDHVIVPDWDQEFEWNEHFIILPQKCRICLVKSFKVLEVTKSIYKDWLLKKENGHQKDA